ncbi:MAG: hypothetical protein K0R61_690 [Microvirga sp.]|jgi:hypothetical protein|nr:hypothetical protein [Microvirga sp.]MDF2970240.1 hypothetical protein [Microvirga sp.]
MKRSSALRARRWLIQELTRSLNQLSDTTARVALSGDGNFSGGGEKSNFSEN